MSYLHSWQSCLSKLLTDGKDFMLFSLIVSRLLGFTLDLYVFVIFIFLVSHVVSLLLSSMETKNPQPVANVDVLFSRIL